MAGVVGDYVLCDCTLKEHDHFVTSRQRRRHRQLYPRRTDLIADDIGLTDSPRRENLRSHRQEMLRRIQSRTEEEDVVYFNNRMALIS